MHDVRWERWLDGLARDYFVAVYRPELPAEERLRAATAARESLVRLGQGGKGAMRYLVAELASADTQRRSAAARVVSAYGDEAHGQVLVACYLEPDRQWLSPGHLVRLARRHPLDPALAGRLADVPLRVQPSLVRALLGRDRPMARVHFQRLLLGPDQGLAEAAVEAVAGWDSPSLLHGVLHRADGTEQPSRVLIAAAIQAALHLARRGSAQALDWLEERTGDADAELAGLAHAALGCLGWPGCLLELSDHLRESDGAALGYGLEAAAMIASTGLVPALCDVVARHAGRRGPGLDDNPSDHAIRVLERLTGRWIAPELCSYDNHGNLDASTRRRAVLLYRSVAVGLADDVRVRGGELLSRAHLVEDLLSPSVRRARAAAVQLEVRTGVDPGFDPREDLLANLDAVRAWQRQLGPGETLAGRFAWRNQEVPAPRIRV